MTDEDMEDRISRLPDELIHKILSYLEMNVAVQTSALSKRWKLIWTTLPVLNFNWYDQTKPKKPFMFLRHVLNNRNHQSCIYKLNLHESSTKFAEGLSQKLVKYAISHNVRYLTLILNHRSNIPYKLSTFSSNSIQKLKLYLELEKDVLESDGWVLPSLTTLHLKRPLYSIFKDLPKLCLTSLPSLTTLQLDYWDLRNSSVSFNLPSLITLHLCRCKLPQTVWNFPALKTLSLFNVVFPENMSDIFAALVTLENLSLSFRRKSIHDYFIPCPQLLNLEIKTNHKTNGNIVVLAPKLTSFTSVGIFLITLGVSKLDNVNIKLYDRNHEAPLKKLKLLYYQRFTFMFSGLGSAKILTLHLDTIEALSLISDFLASSPSPFYNLEYVKLPQGCKETSISSTLRSYLLGASPTATFVTSLPQNNMISHRAAASVTAQNVVLQEPLVAPTKVLVDSENTHKTVCIDPVDMRVQEEHVVQNSVVDANRVRQVGAPVEGTGNDRVSSSRGNSDFGLWRGHEINSEFVCLLDLIMNKYPETFEHFTTKNKKFCTMKLNMLCTSVNDFTEISMTEVDTEMIAEYRDVFAELQKLGFNVSWLVSRLNFIEQLRFSQPLLPELRAIDCRIDDTKNKLQALQICIDDTKTKLQDLQTLRSEKMQEIQKAFGTMGINLAFGCIGDNLLSGT